MRKPRLIQSFSADEEEEDWTPDTFRIPTLYNELRLPKKCGISWTTEKLSDFQEELSPVASSDVLFGSSVCVCVCVCVCVNCPHLSV